MKRIIFIYLTFVFSSCVSNSEEGKTYDFRKEISNLKKREVKILAKIEEINGMEVNDYNLPVFLEKSVLINKNEELYVKIKGWALDSISKKKASIVYIDVNNKLFKAKYGVERINETNEMIKKSGFECEIPLSEIGFFPRQI